MRHDHDHYGQRTKQVEDLPLFGGTPPTPPPSHTVRVRAHERTVPGPAPVRGEVGRDTAIKLLEEKRSELVALLRAEAERVYSKHQKPISVNDIRHVLEQQRYEGDPRILGSAFSGWLRVGTTRTDSKLANARDIATFMPREP